MYSTNFDDIVNNSKYFMMNQISDITEENKFNHVSFVGKTAIEDILKLENPLKNNVNTLVNDKHIQMFITKKISEENNEIKFDNFTIIKDYSEIFNGFIRVEDYYILINSLNNTYNVYLLVNTNTCPKQNESDKDIEYYGFIKIGYLINPRGYTEEELLEFEDIVNFKLKKDIRQYLLNRSIIKIENKLYHINLVHLSDEDINNLSLPFGYQGLKVITNKNKTIEEESEYFKNIKHGFLFIGLSKNISIIADTNLIIPKMKVEMFLLLNYEDCDTPNYNFSIWTNTYNNTNFDQESNDNDIDYLNRKNISKTLKFLINYE